MALDTSQLIVTLDTKVAHVIDDDEESLVCDQYDIDADKITELPDGSIVYGQRYWGSRGLIHEDDDWRPRAYLCSVCDDMVADELQDEFDEDIRQSVEGLGSDD